MATIPEPGAVIGKKYRLDAEIGRGAAGVVFRGTDLTVDRAVAVKLLIPQGDSYRHEVVARFRREARALASLSGQHSIRLFDFGTEADGLMYAVFELLEGVNLSVHLHQHGPMSEQAVRHVLCQVLAALNEAHAAGLLHRDVKPSNIQVYQYLDDPLHVKLMDFGLARGTGPDAVVVTRAGGVVGTPRYMSPQQAMGLDVDESSDLYSLGLVALEMLTGDERTMIDAFRAGEHTLAVTPELADAVRRMVDKSPATRCSSASELLTLLRGEQSPTQAAPKPVEELQVESDATVVDPAPLGASVGAKRNILPGVIITAITVVITGVATLWFVRESRPVQPMNADPPVRAQPRAEIAQQDEPATPTVGELAVADGCGKHAKTGTRAMEQLDGLARLDWTLHVPKNYAPDIRHPLIVAFHGGQQTPKNLLDHAGFAAAMDEQGAVVVAPHAESVYGFDREREDVSEYIGFVTKARELLCIDENRIYALGVDLGGGPAERLACEPWIAALATTSFRLRNFEDPCPDRAIPRLIFSPDDSRHIPLTDEPRCMGAAGFGLPRYEAYWRARNGCGDEPADSLQLEGAACKRWVCDAIVVSCIVEGGMQWPGMPYRQLADMTGCDGPTPSFDYTGVIWRFFDDASNASHQPGLGPQ